MEKFFHKYVFQISVILLVLSVTVFSTQVLAKGKPEGVGNPNEILSQDIQKHPDIPASTSGQEHKPAFAEGHLRDAKLRACQAHSKSITTRSTHINELVLRMEKTFDSIAQGIENHYLTKLVPEGKTLSNYDALVAAIQTQKNALIPLLLATQTDVTSFSCDGNNPSAQLTQYRTNMQAVIQGLQAYKKAVRNLIVGVASVQGVTEKETNKPSPKVLPTSSIELTPTTVVSPTVVQTTP